MFREPIPISVFGGGIGGGFGRRDILDDKFEEEGGVARFHGELCAKSENTREQNASRTAVGLAVGSCRPKKIYPVVTVMRIQLYAMK